MAINLSCQCGKNLAVKEELAGKKVKCPGCGSILTVPAQSDEAPSDDAGGDAPAARTKAAGPPKKSRTLLYAGVGVGVLLLSCCCLGGVGTGAWFFLLRGGPEKPLLGKWAVDIDATKKNSSLFKDMTKGMPPKMVEEVEKKLGEELAKVEVEIKSDGTMTMTDPKGKKQTGKWKNAEVKGDIITIETKEDSPSEQWEKYDFKVIDNAHVQMTSRTHAEKNLWLKRI